MASMSMIKSGRLNFGRKNKSNKTLVITDYGLRR